MSPKEEEYLEEPVEVEVLKEILGSVMKPKPDLSSYTCSMNLEERIDWITEISKFFEYEEMDEERKLEFVVTKLKSDATLWSDGVHVERRRKNKHNIKRWDRMVAELKGKFLLKYYQLTLFKSMQNLRERAMTVKEYTK